VSNLNCDQQPNINLQALNQLEDLDDSEFLHEFLQKVREVLLDSLQSLGKAVEGNQTEAIRFHAHKIKGSASNIGADYLQRLASNLESSAKPDRETALDPRYLYLEIKNECRAILEFLSQRYCMKSLQ
jgi:HPt (histidine-containing phosphotransfer) domain-containing protein